MYASSCTNKDDAIRFEMLNNLRSGQTARICGNAQLRCWVRTAVNPLHVEGVGVLRWGGLPQWKTSLTLRVGVSREEENHINPKRQQGVTTVAKVRRGVWNESEFWRGRTRAIRVRVEKSDPKPVRSDSGD
jgi:hypothetical protein